MTPIAIVGCVLGVLTFLGGVLAAIFKITSALTEIKILVKQMAKVVVHVPNLNYRVTNIERRLEMSAPDLPLFYQNGHGSSED